MVPFTEAQKGPESMMKSRKSSKAEINPSASFNTAFQNLANTAQGLDLSSSSENQKYSKESVDYANNQIDNMDP